MSAQVISLPVRSRAVAAPAGRGDDVALLYAVEQFPELRAKYLSIPLENLSSDQQCRFERITDAWEDRILEAEVTTLLGVHAKLRYLLSRHVEDDRVFSWLLAYSIPTDEHHTFNNVQNGLWELIEATARLAGNLR